MREQAFTAYNVRMQTSIGSRRGQMTVCIRSGRVVGYLNILQHSEPFEGTIDDSGNCKITGKLITLMRTVHYAATGTITPERLYLSLSDGQHILEITGTPCQA